MALIKNLNITITLKIYINYIMDKLKNLVNNCSKLELEHKESLQKLEMIIKNSESKLSTLREEEQNEILQLINRAKEVMLTPEQLNKLKKEQVKLCLTL